MQYAANTLEPYWMPFTANREFKENPRLIERAEGMYYWTHRGGKVIDGSAGLFCVAAGHGRREIADAVAKQFMELDYSPPFQFSLVMGVLGGIPASAKNLVHQVEQLPPDSHWQVIGIGRHQWRLAAAAVSMGGNVRVGLEDHLYLPDGRLAPSNGDLVEKAAQLVRLVGSEPATPAEARQILGLT
ncbi:MAG: 3-keto-5-aminohexanoate cleavage protein [Anaerolineae bacterium]